MKNYNIKVIVEEKKGFDDTYYTQSDGGFRGASTPTIKKKQSVSRNELQAKYLTKHFDFTQDKDLQNALRNIKLFQELAIEIPEKQMFNLYRELLHYEYQPRQIVFNQGEIGREFYIILKGAVYIIGNEDKKRNSDTRNNNKVDEESEQDQDIMSISEQKIEEVEKKPTQPLVQTNTSKLARKLQKKSTFHVLSQKQEQINPPSNKSSENLKPVNAPSKQQGSFQYNSLKRTSSIVLEYDDSITDEEYIKQNFPEFDILAKLEAGASFGEVALRDSVPRTATAICSGDTHFITLKRDAFKCFLEQYYSVVQQQNITFVKNIALYKNWTEQMINQMFYFLEKKTFRMNQTIYKEGSTPLGIFLIRQGEVKIYQEMQLATDKEDKLKNVRHFMRKIEPTKTTNLFQAPLSHLGEGQMFGHEDIVDQAQRKYTAVCSSSSCTLLFLNKELSKRRNTIENAAEESAMKEKWHREIVSKLESFTKNQNEYYKKQELLKKQTVEYQELRRINNQLLQKKSTTLYSPVSKGVNRSLPIISQISMLQISTDEISPKAFHKQSQVSIDNGFNQFDEIYITDTQTDPKVQNHLQKISQISFSQPKIFWDDKSRYKQELSDVCITPVTAENTPLQSELLIKTSLKNPAYKNYDCSLNTEEIRHTMEYQGKTRHLSDVSIDIFGRVDLKLQNIYQANQSTNNISHITKENLPIFSTPQKNIQNSPHLIKGATSPMKGHRRFLSHQQESLSKVLENTFHDYGHSQTIRKSSLSKNQLKRSIQDSLHAPKLMQHSLSYLQDSQNNLEEQTNTTKLDIDNQIIPVCSSVVIFQKRIENKYPQFVSYGKQNSQPSILPPQTESQIQQRILRSLKLPKVRKGNGNLMEVFKPIVSSNTQKNTSSERDQTQQEIPSSFFNQKIQKSNYQSPDNQSLKKKISNKVSSNSKSIIETLQAMKQQLADKKNQEEMKSKKSLDSKDKQSPLTIMETRFQSKKDLLQSQLNTPQIKHLFDIRNLKVSNYNFLDQFNDISHTPTALKQAIAMQNFANFQNNNSSNNNNK